MTKAQLAKYIARHWYRAVIGTGPGGASCSVSGPHARMAYYSDGSALVYTDRFAVAIPNCTLSYADYIYRRAVRLMVK